MEIGEVPYSNAQLEAHALEDGPRTMEVAENYYSEVKTVQILVTMNE